MKRKWLVTIFVPILALSIITGCQTNDNNDDNLPQDNAPLDQNDNNRGNNNNNNDGTNNNDGNLDRDTDNNNLRDNDNQDDNNNLGDNNDNFDDNLNDSPANQENHP